MNTKDQLIAGPVEDTPTLTASRDRSTDFRPDINGLRSIAVATVVLFHFGVPGFRGGFVGVDCFGAGPDGRAAGCAVTAD